MNCVGRFFGSLWELAEYLFLNDWQIYRRWVGGEWSKVEVTTQNDQFYCWTRKSAEDIGDFVREINAQYIDAYIDEPVGAKVLEGEKWDENGDTVLVKDKPVDLVREGTVVLRFTYPEAISLTAALTGLDSEGMLDPLARKVLRKLQEAINEAESDFVKRNYDEWL